MNEPAIEVSDLRKSYGPVEAVRGLSLRRGARRGLRPARPQRRRQDHHRGDPRGLPRALRRRRARARTRPRGAATADLQERVGIVLQSCGFYPRLTVREAVEHFAKAYPAPARPGGDHRARGPGGQGRRRARTSSRAASAAGSTWRWRSWATPSWSSSTSPPPASTPPRAAPPGAWCARLRDLGKTVLLTTHYLDEAQALADRVAIVKDGAIVAEGPPGELGRRAAGYRVSLRVGRPAGRAPRPTTPPICCIASPATRSPGASGSRGSRSTRPTLEDVYLELTEEDRPMSRARPSPGSSSGSSASSSGATRARRSSTSSCRSCCSCWSPRCSRATRTSSRSLIPGIAGHERDGHDVQRAGLQPHVPARAGHPQAGARHADAGRLLLRRASSATRWPTRSCRWRSWWRSATWSTT